MFLLTAGMWTAPELLRDLCPQARGTKAGDVYSFAIVLYEILTRNGPFGNSTLSENGKQNNHILNQRIKTSHVTTCF